MTMPKVFVCSPLRAGNGRTFEQNVVFARRLCGIATRAGYAAFAPHLFYPQFLNDALPHERELGMRAGKAWLEVSDEFWVYGHNPSECSLGMLAEVDFAQSKTGVRIVWMPVAWKELIR